MGKGIYSAVSGAVGSLRQLDVLANNLANISTSGFKAQRVTFSEVLGQRIAGGPPTDATFVAVSGARADLQQGPLQRTDSPLDVALEGPGYLVVKEGNKPALIRGGSLSIDTAGRLTGPGGQPLLDTRKRPIVIDKDAGTLSLERDGTVKQHGERLGRLLMVEADKPQQLLRIADTLYRAPAGVTLAQASRTGLRAGYVEKSNINPVRGMTQMITASRAYEAFHRVISTFREVDSAAARISTER